jgi:tetratricopeptide (TPR) repeat protein
MKVYKKSVFFICLSVVLFMAGCSSVKGLFSKGQDELKQASEAFSSGDELQAMVHATQSVIIDPEFFQGKTFIKDRFDKSIENAVQRLAMLQNPTNSANAEEKYVMLSKLVKIYDNLKQIKMPLSHPKGKWKWDTQIVDYTQEKELARKQTFDLFLQEGRAALASNLLKESESAFRRAVREFAANDAEKNETSKVIADEICAQAAGLMNTRNIEQAILSYNFYRSALGFVSAHQPANTGVTASAAHVASLYYDQGLGRENSKEIEQMIASVEDYKNAVKWEKTNKTYQDALNRVTTSIAEYYYVAGQKAEKAKDIPTAIAQYESVRKWIPDYKDAMSKIYNLRIGGKVDELVKNIATTKTEHAKFESRVTSVSKVVDSSNDVMGKVTYISDESRSLNTTMKNTARTLKAFTMIPVVGTTTNILAKSIDIAQDPVGVVATKFDAIEKPVITPTKSVVEKTKSVVDNVKGKMSTTGTAVQTAETYTKRLKECISKMVVEKNFQEAEQAIDELNRGLVEVNKTMKSLDGNLAKVETQGKKIAAMSGNINKVSNGFKTVGKAVDKITPVIKELDGVLDKQFGVASYKFSARKILEGISGPAKWVMDQLSNLVMAAIKPVLNKFNIDIPSVPGISDLAKQLDQFKGIYDGMLGEYESITKSATEYTNYQKVITSNLTKLQKSVGCELAPAN